MKYQLSPDDAYPVGAARQCDELQAIWWVTGLGQQIGIFCLSVALLVVFQISARSVAGSICVNLQSWQIWERMSEALHFFPHYVTHNPWVFLHTCQSAGNTALMWPTIMHPKTLQRKVGERIWTKRVPLKEETNVFSIWSGYFYTSCNRSFSEVFLLRPMNQNVG